VAQIDYFPYFWLAVVTFIGGYHLIWAIHDIRVGTSRTGLWSGSEYSRAEQPFEFWMAVAPRLAGVAVAAFMIVFGSQMLGWAK